MTVGHLSGLSLRRSLEHRAEEGTGAASLGFKQHAKRPNQLLIRHLGESQHHCRNLSGAWSGSVMSVDSGLILGHRCAKVSALL